MSDGPDRGTRLGFAVMGLILGAISGWGAHDYFSIATDSTPWIVGGALIGAVIGFVAPHLLDLLVHLF